MKKNKRTRRTGVAALALAAVMTANTASMVYAEEETATVKEASCKTYYTLPDGTRTELICNASLQSNYMLDISILNTEYHEFDSAYEVELFKFNNGMYDTTAYASGDNYSISDFITGSGIPVTLKVDEDHPLHVGELLTVSFYFSNEGAEYIAEKAADGTVYTSVYINDAQLRVGFAADTEDYFLRGVDDTSDTSSTSGNDAPYMKLTMNELDINGDGEVNAADAAIILVICAELGAGNSIDDLTAYY